jgi:hypothetical protein
MSEQPLNPWARRRRSGTDSCNSRHLGSWIIGRQRISAAATMVRVNPLSLSGVLRSARIWLLRRFRRSDRARWSRTRALDSSWDERTRIMAAGVTLDSRLIDVGAGRQVLRGLVKSGNYTPVDIVKRTEDTLVCDLNAGIFPSLSGDALIASGVLEYVYDLGPALKWFASVAPTVIFSYSILELTPNAHDRHKLGWLTDLREADIQRAIESSGLHLERSQDWNRSRIYFTSVSLGD